MKIAKEYKWEMGHRLSFHNGKCKNLHGHSYKCCIELSGELDTYGMLLDFYKLDFIINPIIDKLDHSFMIYEKDSEVINSLNSMNSKIVIVKFQTTAENICNYFLERIKNSNLPINIKSVKVRIYETDDAYAEEVG